MPSTRSSSRARTTEQRGFALVAAVALAVLYFGLIELMLLDSARELAEARRFRSRVVAAVLAENGAELAARGIVEPGKIGGNVDASSWQGTITADLKKAPSGDFLIEAKGTSAGLAPSTASVTVQGKVAGNQITVYFTTHKP